jgi:Holliday junction DNA helicase RuvA
VYTSSGLSFFKGRITLIDYITGKLESIQTGYIVVECNQIGYQIHCPNPFEFKKSLHMVLTVYTYQYVREDIIALYGFKNRNAKLLFVKLLNVSGIGPKGALAILAVGQPDQVVHAIENEDDGFLTKFPGVGKKTARQMILDLKGKLTGFTNQDIQDTSSAVHSENNNDPLNEAVEALKALGYAQKEIQKILPIIKQEELTTDQYIKKALQQLLKS